VDHRFRDKTIEVKSAAYVQSWAQEKLSTISFDIGKKTPWFAETNKYGSEPVRSADYYIFALYTEKDVKKANVLNVDDWKFYVLSKETIEKEFKDQKRVMLERIASLCVPVAYDQLRETVEHCLEKSQ
jgi:hypothetical protein